MTERAWSEFFAQAEGSCVEIQIPTARVYYRTVTIETGGEDLALLLADAITQEMQARVRMIVKKAYEQGWRDKAAKRRKATNFNECINDYRYDSMQAW